MIHYMREYWYMCCPMLVAYCWAGFNCYIGNDEGFWMMYAFGYIIQLLLFIVIQVKHGAWLEGFNASNNLMKD